MTSSASLAYSLMFMPRLVYNLQVIVANKSVGDGGGGGNGPGQETFINFVSA